MRRWGLVGAALAVTAVLTTSCGAAPRASRRTTTTTVPASSTATTPEFHWTAPTAVSTGQARSRNSINAISCASDSFCLAINYVSNAYIYNGISWSGPTAIPDEGTLGNLVKSVSCPSAAFCEAVDAEGNSLAYNGAEWSAPKMIDTADLVSVSCPSASFCMAVDAQGRFLMFNGIAWSAPAPIPGVTTADDVSCPSTDFCAAGVTHGTAIWGGTSWSSPGALDGSSATYDAESVACSSTTFCMAVDEEGTSFAYDGTSWSSSIPITDTADAIDAIACGTAWFCMAVDNAGNALSFNGSSWSSPDSIDSGVAFLAYDSISCLPTMLCAAADQNGNVLMYESMPPPNTVTIGDWTGVEPNIIDFSGDAGNIVSKITWTSWGAESAFGHGSWGYDNCQPDCAGGTVTYYSTTISLSDPVNGQFTHVIETQSGPYGGNLTFTLPDRQLGGAS